MTQLATTVPGLVAGVWSIDPIHSDVSFTVRHMMVSKVRGSFRTFSGTITVADDLLGSRVEADVDLNSIDTNQTDRDNHIRSKDFFDVENHPTMTFRSTSLKADGDDWTVSGDLSLHGVTKQVDLALEFNGAGPDPYGGTRSGFTAKTRINRNDFGVDIKLPMDGGGVVVGEKIDIVLEIEAVLQPAE